MAPAISGCVCGWPEGEQVAMFDAMMVPRYPETEAQTTVRCRSMQVRSTSSIGLPHQSLEKISISE